MFIARNIKDDLNEWIKSFYLLLIKIIFCLKSHFINAVLQQFIIRQQVGQAAVSIGDAAGQFRPFVILTLV